MSGFHSAARSWLGEQSYSALMKRLEQLRNVAQSKIAHGRALSAWYEKATAAIPQDTREQDKLEELAGYAIEMHANGTEQPTVIRKLVEDFLSTLRTAIIKHMPNGKVKLWALNNLKPQDLARMAVAGMKSIVCRNSLYFYNSFRLSGEFADLYFSCGPAWSWRHT